VLKKKYLFLIRISRYITTDHKRSEDIRQKLKITDIIKIIINRYKEYVRTFGKKPEG
jgi:hypothetical protein